MSEMFPNLICTFKQSIPLLIMIEWLTIIVYTINPPERHHNPNSNPPEKPHNPNSNPPEKFITLTLTPLKR
jgi:hypothetical protein